jgi:hypothetical protein
MTTKSKKLRNKHYNRKSIKRNRKSIKNNRLKKYGGVKPTIKQPLHIFITYYGEDFYQPDGMEDGGMTIGRLIDSKRGIFNLYHHGRLLSRYYPSNALVFKALHSDGEPGHYNIQVTRIIKGEEPPETIPIAEVIPIVMPDPYDDGYW